MKKNPIFAARKPGSLAQLVQSIALTRRGSLVRVQQFPQKNGIAEKQFRFFSLKFRV